MGAHNAPPPPLRDACGGASYRRAPRCSAGALSTGASCVSAASSGPSPSHRTPPSRESSCSRPRARSVSAGSSSGAVYYRLSNSSNEEEDPAVDAAIAASFRTPVQDEARRRAIGEAFERGRQASLAGSITADNVIELSSDSSGDDDNV